MIINTDELSFNKPKPPKLSMEEIYRRLSCNLKPIMDYDYNKILDESKYVRLAREHHYANYKLFLYGDLKKWGMSESFTTYQKRFFAEAGASIAVMNTMNGNLISIVFRSASAKEFMNYSLFYSLYGYDMIDPNFKYGDFLVITEGLYDADVLRQIYPNVVATQTSNVTVIQSAVLKTMTNRFIIAFDDDKAGISGFSKAVTRLGSNIKRLPIFPGDKDIGEMEEKRYENPQEFSIRYQFYKEELQKCFEDTSMGFSL